MTLNFSQRAASGSQCVIFRWWRMSLLSCPCHTILTCYLREGRCPVTSGSESPCFWAHWCRFQITCRIEALGAKPGTADWKTPKMAFQWWHPEEWGGLSQRRLHLYSWLEPWLPLDLATALTSESCSIWMPAHSRDLKVVILQAFSCG